MGNPCKKCIVQPACRKSCDEFIFYLSTILRKEFLFDTHVLNVQVADNIRKGIFMLGNTSWRLCPYGQQR